MIEQFNHDLTVAHLNSSPLKYFEIYRSKTEKEPSTTGAFLPHCEGKGWASGWQIPP